MPVIEIIYDDGQRRSIIPVNKIQAVCLVPAFTNNEPDGYNLTISTGYMAHNQYWKTKEDALEVYNSILTQLQEIK